MLFLSAAGLLGAVMITWTQVWSNLKNRTSFPKIYKDEQKANKKKKAEKEEKKKREAELAAKEESKGDDYQQSEESKGGDDDGYDAAAYTRVADGPIFQ